MSDRSKVLVKCLWCDKQYNRWPHHHNWSIRHGREEFCSPACHYNLRTARATYRRLNSHHESSVEALKLQSYPCVKCGKQHNGQYGSGRFCSEFCARSAAGAKNPEISSKIGRSNSGRIHYDRRVHPPEYYLPGVCPVCGSASKPKKTCCSQSCSSKLLWQNDEYRKKITENQLALIAAGTHKGWSSRTKLKPSYPEQFMMNVLDKNGISYEREFKCGRYFIDFAIHDKMVALEVDGKQHNEPDRKIRDKKKDALLTSKGWKVVRIKWYNPINDKNKDLMRSQIDLLLEQVSPLAGV